MPTFHARLILPDQQPLAGAVVRLVVWSPGGRSKTLVEGKTNAQGSLALAAEFPEELSLLPRTGVQLRSGSSWRDLGDSPIKVSRDLIDFGTLIVSNEPSLLIGTRKIYAVESASLAKLAQPIDSKLAELGGLGGLGDEPLGLPSNKEELEQALLESLAKNKQLDAKLVELDTKLFELDAELAGARKQLQQTKASLAEYEQAAPLVDVVEDLGSQLGSAAKTLDQAALGMVLGDVSISLKGV